MKKKYDTITLSRIAMILGEKKYPAFLKWMTGQTVAIGKHGETLVYEGDWKRYKRGLPIVD